MAPTALLYGAKRNELPRPSLDTVSSPPKTRRDTRSTPARISELSIAEAITLNPDAVGKCRAIIKTIRSRPLRDKQAILPQTNRPPIRKKSTKVMPKKKPQIRKKAHPTKKAPTKIKCFLNPSELLTTIRKDTFCPTPKILSGYTPYVVATLSSEINKHQLE